MKCTAGFWSPRLASLIVAMGLLAACAASDSDPAVAVCPPVVEYSAELQPRAVGELELPMEATAIVEMLGDFAVTREQARWLR